MTKGYFVTTADRWSAKNRAEDPYTNGPFDPDDGIPPRLAAEDIDLDGMDAELSLASYDGAESEPSDASGFSEVAHPPTEDLLRNGLRQEVAARLQRRLAEREAGDLVLALVGASPRSRDRRIADLEDQINGLPEDLSKKRALLRREAFDLAPRNLTEMIGEPNARGRS
ncbi:hypothetical protein K8R04_04265 [Candidatus Uhrbacteria bacterium]|nr:hypothetical protein [Candidatus Uhrbacteria bacterium]